MCHLDLRYSQTNLGTFWENCFAGIRFTLYPIFYQMLAAGEDGDGAMEIAYVDRPHLARLIRVWRFAGGTLELVGELPGYTNHAIGESDIAGGIRDCGQGPELIVADAGWRDIYAITMKAAGEFAATRIGPHQGRGSFAAALACE